MSGSLLNLSNCQTLHDRIVHKVSYHTTYRNTCTQIPSITFTRPSSGGDIQDWTKKVMIWLNTITSSFYQYTFDMSGYVDSLWSVVGTAMGAIKTRNTKPLLTIAGLTSGFERHTSTGVVTHGMPQSGDHFGDWHYDDISTCVEAMKFFDAKMWLKVATISPTSTYMYNAFQPSPRPLGALWDPIDEPNLTEHESVLRPYINYYMDPTSWNPSLLTAARSSLSTRPFGLYSLDQFLPSIAYYRNFQWMATDVTPKRWEYRPTFTAWWSTTNSDPYPSSYPDAIASENEDKTNIKFKAAIFWSYNHEMDTSPTLYIKGSYFSNMTGADGTGEWIQTPTGGGMPPETTLTSASNPPYSLRGLAWQEHTYVCSKQTIIGEIL